MRISYGARLFFRMRISGADSPKARRNWNVPVFLLFPKMFSMRFIQINHCWSVREANKEPRIYPTQAGWSGPTAPVLANQSKLSTSNNVFVLITFKYLWNGKRRNEFFGRWWRHRETLPQPPWMCAVCYAAVLQFIGSLSRSTLIG